MKKQTDDWGGQSTGFHHVPAHRQIELLYNDQHNDNHDHYQEEAEKNKERNMFCWLAVDGWRWTDDGEEGPNGINCETQATSPSSPFIAMPFHNSIPPYPEYNEQEEGGGGGEGRGEEEGVKQMHYWWLCSRQLSFLVPVPPLLHPLDLCWMLRMVVVVVVSDGDADYVVLMVLSHAVFSPIPALRPPFALRWDLHEWNRRRAERLALTLTLQETVYCIHQKEGEEWEKVIVNVVDEICNMSFRVRCHYENIRCKYVCERAPRVRRTRAGQGNRSMWKLVL